MKQLGLFSQDAGSTTSTAGPFRPDDDTAQVLAVFRDRRLAEGAHPRSVARDVGQMRAVMREARLVDQSVTLRGLMADQDLLARLLREPATMVARSTGRDRLRAVQQFIRTVGPSVGRDPSSDLAALDAQLPTRRSMRWHSAGTIVAGSPGRRRRRGPTLDASDLRRIVDAAGAASGGRSRRDRALVALHCFSGLRPEEIVDLGWEDLSAELAANGRYGLTADVVRDGRPVKLLLSGPASETVEALAAATGGAVESLAGPVIRARGRPSQPLSYRAARDVLQDAIRRAGLPSVDSAALRAACAHWLRAQGLSDHEVASVLGLARMRSVDRLLRHHAALDAQRLVRERLLRP